MNLSPAIFSAVIAVVSAPLVMALVRRIRPLQHEPDSHKSFAELSREYGRWEILSIPLSLVFVTILALLIWQALLLLYQRQLAALEPAQFLLVLPDILWLTPALMFALFLSALPFHFLYRGLLGRRRYAEYTEYLNQKFRLDTWKLFRYLGNLMLPLCLLLTLLALDCYLRVTDDRFIVNPFLGLGERSRMLDDVRRVAFVVPAAVPNEEIAWRAHYVLEFDDGERVSLRQSLGAVPLSRQQRVAAHVARVAGIEIAIEESVQ